MKNPAVRMKQPFYSDQTKTKRAEQDYTIL